MRVYAWFRRSWRLGGPTIVGIISSYHGIQFDVCEWSPMVDLSLPCFIVGFTVCCLPQDPEVSQVCKVGLDRRGRQGREGVRGNAAHEDQLDRQVKT